MTDHTDLNTQLCAMLGIDIRDRQISAVNLRLRVDQPPTIFVREYIGGTAETTSAKYEVTAMRRIDDD